MRNRLFSLLIGVIVSLCLTFSVNAEARYCKWVPAHWSHGHHIPAHKVCYSHRHCRWVKGHWYHGVWHPSHKVCWH